MLKFEECGTDLDHPLEMEKRDIRAFFWYAQRGRWV